jgi:hypothetical protein
MDATQRKLMVGIVIVTLILFAIVIADLGEGRPPRSANASSRSHSAGRPLAIPYRR